MNAKNGKPAKDRLDRIEETVRMTTLQIAANAKAIQQTSKAIERMAQEHNREMKEIRAEHRRSRAEHDRDMKEIRGLFKDMIRRIAY